VLFCASRCFEERRTGDRHVEALNVARLGRGHSDCRGEQTERDEDRPTDHRCVALNKGQTVKLSTGRREVKAGSYTGESATSTARKTIVIRTTR